MNDDDFVMCKAILEEERFDTRFFTKDFFLTFLKDRAMACLCNGSYKHVHRTDFYATTGQAYNRFLAVCNEAKLQRVWKVVLQIPGCTRSYELLPETGSYEETRWDDLITASLIRLLSREKVWDDVIGYCGKDEFALSVYDQNTKAKVITLFYTKKGLKRIMRHKDSFLEKSKERTHNDFLNMTRAMEGANYG